MSVLRYLDHLLKTIPVTSAPHLIAVQGDNQGCIIKQR